MYTVQICAQFPQIIDKHEEYVQIVGRLEDRGNVQRMDLVSLTVDKISECRIATESQLVIDDAILKGFWLQANVQETEREHNGDERGECDVHAFVAGEDGIEPK